MSSRFDGSFPGYPPPLVSRVSLVFPGCVVSLLCVLKGQRARRERDRLKRDTVACSLLVTARALNGPPPGACELDLDLDLGTT